MFDRGFLSGLRLRALRRRVWFRSLDNLERGIFDLAVQVVDRVESSLLGSVMVKIVKKLRDSLKSDFARFMEESGYRIAWSISEIAVKLGYEAAAAWARDLGFVRYLTTLAFYKPSGWG